MERLAPARANNRLGLKDMPDEILSYILSKVHRMVGNDALHCMQVNKLWQHSMTECITSVIVRRSPGGISPLRSVARFENLTNLRIDIPEEEILVRFAANIKLLGPRCTKLTTLIIHEVDLTYKEIFAIQMYCTHLEILEMSLKSSHQNETVTKLPPLKGLTCLKSLILDNFDSLENVKSLTSLVTLEHLDLGVCNLSGFPPLNKLQNLQYLRVHAEPLGKLSVAGLQSLHTLHLFGCSSLQAIPKLETLPLLRSLTLCYYESMDVHPQFERMPQLEHLFVGINDEETLELFISPPNLKRLELSLFEDNEGCPLTAFSSIEELELDLHQAGELPGLAPLQSLRYLRLTELGQTNHFRELLHLPHLQKLHVEGSFLPETIPEVTHLTSLLELKFTECETLRSLPPLLSLQLLTDLHFDNCPSLVLLPSLTALASLHSLTITKCTALSEIPAIPPSLRILRAVENRFRRLPSLKSSELIEEIDLKGCCQLADIPPVSSLPRLKSLNIEGCETLTEMLKEMDVNKAAEDEAMTWLSDE